MMNVWVAGTTRKSAAPSTFARSTLTLPSSGPGMSHEPIGFRLRSPVMIPRVNVTGPSLVAMPVLSVPSWEPDGPRKDRSMGESAKASIISLPWFGGLSITTRPSWAKGLSDRKLRTSTPPREWVTKCTRLESAAQHSSNALPRLSTRTSIGSEVDGYPNVTTWYPACSRRSTPSGGDGEQAERRDSAEPSRTLRTPNQAFSRVDCAKASSGLPLE